LISTLIQKEDKEKDENSSVQSYGDDEVID
jgi:hypothetical protein